MRKHTSNGLTRAEQISSKTVEIQNRNPPIVASLPHNTNNKSNKESIKGADKNVIKKEETTHLLSTSSIKSQFTFFDHVTSQLKRINYFNILALCAISILTNVIYFNFVYLPSLKGVNDHMLTSQLELPAAATDKSDYSVGKYFGSLFALSSLIKFPKLSYSSSSSESSTAKNSDNPQGFQFGISWDHVSYGHMDDTPRPNEPANSQPAFIAGLLDDSKSNMKKSLEARRKESQMALKLALSMQKAGKPNKASKVLKFALSMDPDNPELLAAYGEHLEHFKNDIVAAEHFYRRAVSYEPEHVDANLNLRRATPIVSKIDRQMLNTIDELLKLFYEIPSTSSALRHAKKEAYFMHIYHSNAIEGNTLNLHQTRHILENRMSVGGKSVQEHNEVLGLDAAMKYINQTLLYKPLNEFTVEDIKEIHRRVLGYCDPIESGQFRKHQVYVGKFTPPGPEKVEEEMNKFVEWLNSNQLQLAHPIQIATLVHYKFVYIHPFYDGNGRTGRLLMNLILMKFGYPPIIILKEQRLEYYECLIKGNQGDLKPLVRFIARCTQRTLKDYIDQCNRSNKLGADDPKKLIRSDLVTTEDDYFLEKSPITRQESALTATITDNADLNDDKDDLDDNIDTISDNLVNTGKFSFVRQDDYESNDKK